MASEEIVVSTAVAVGGYVGAKLFGGALATMGDDINKLYVKGRDKIVEIATKKVENPDDGKQVNIRAARDVLWSGTVTEDEVCAEYFGGMLAAARSEGGKDDGVVHYVDTVKAMSARQLELHYIIYKSWHSLLIQSGKSLNVAESSDIRSQHVCMAALDFARRQMPYDRDLTVLYRLGLIFQFKYGNYIVGDVVLPYIDVIPTTFGVMLFAIAHNKIETWRNFGAETYESVAGIEPLNYFAESLESLCAVVDIPFVPEV